MNQYLARLIANLCRSEITDIIECLWKELTSTAEAYQFVNYLMRDFIRDTNLEKLSKFSYTGLVQDKPLEDDSLIMPDLA